MSTWAITGTDARSGNRRQPRTRPCARRSPLAYICRVSSPEGKNLEAIAKAIDHHNRNCEFPAAEIRMNPFEVERLGWDEFMGLPIVPDSGLSTGRFRIVCSRDLEGEGIEEAEALGIPVEVAVPAGPRS